VIQASAPDSAWTATIGTHARTATTSACLTVKTHVLLIWISPRPHATALAQIPTWGLTPPISPISSVAKAPAVETAPCSRKVITLSRAIVSPTMLSMWKQGFAMKTLTTRREWILPGVVLVALGVFGAARAAPPAVVSAADATEPKRSITARQSPPDLFARRGFYEAYLVPRLSARFRDEAAVISAEFANSNWTSLTRDPVDAARIQRLGIRALQSGLKRYAIDSLGIETWSLPLMGRRGGDNAGLANDSRGLRFHVGLSRAPRADLLIPVAAGRVVVSGDVRGRVATTFESTSSKFRLAAHIDVPERTAAVGLSLRF